MSIALINAAWRLSMPASRKLVLLAMCDWSNDEGTSCHPSIKSVALRASMSPRQAQRILRDLVEDGWLTVVGNPNGGAPGQTKQYQLNVAAINTGDTNDTGDIGVTGDNLSRVTPRVETGDTSVMGRVTPVSQTGDTHVTQTTIDPPKNRKSNHQDTKLDLSTWPSPPSSKKLADWLAMRKKKRAPVSDTVIDAMAEQLRLAAEIGWTVDECLTEAVLRNWTGLKAEWLTPKPGHAGARDGPGQGPPRSRQVQSINALNEVTERVITEQSNARLADPRAAQRAAQAGLPEPGITAIR